MYTLLHICIYAYVSFKDGKREIVPTENIRHFDPANFDKNKLYNILWKDKHYYEGAIAFVRGKIYVNHIFQSIATRSFC